jgi:multidrug efflux pump subunit AcrA (membrane-fusion protein)
VPVLAALLSGVAMGVHASDAPLAVEVVVAHAEVQMRDYSLTGEVRARDSVAAAFPIAGQIAEMRVEQGQKVSAGMVLARMESVQQQQEQRAAADQDGQQRIATRTAAADWHGG